MEFGKRIKISALFCIIVSVLLLPLLSYSHPGRTDSSGGHNNRKTGGYHYHGSGKTSMSSESTPKSDHSPTPKAETTNTIQEKDDGNQEQIESTVYVTKTGKKYHRDGCRFLKSRIAISKTDAINRGYGACSVCRP